MYPRAFSFRPRLMPQALLESQNEHRVLYALALRRACEAVFPCVAPVANNKVLTGKPSPLESARTYAYKSLRAWLLDFPLKVTQPVKVNNLF